MIPAILAAANFGGALLSYTLLLYALATLCWRNRGTAFVLVAIIISSQVWFIPQLINTLVFGKNAVLDWAWFLDWICCCFSIVLIWGALREIPPDRANAARIDGCGEFGIYWHVILPLVRPTLILLGALVLIANAGFFLARPSEIFGAGVGSLNWQFLTLASLGMTAAPIAVFFLARRLLTRSI